MIQHVGDLPAADEVEGIGVPAVEAHTLPVDSFADSVVILLVVTVLQRLIGFLRGLVFCRWLSPEELGEWEMCFSFLLMAAPAAILSLPGAFGRYLEYYRLRGHFTTFLRRTAALTTMLACLATLVIGWQSAWFSHLIFGRDDEVVLVRTLAASLVAVIGYNFVCDLFTALRWQKISSWLQAANTTAFALIGVILLWAWPAGAESVVLAYGGAAVVTVLVAAPFIWRACRAAPAARTRVSHVELWRKLIPYAISLWAANWLANLFAMVDRYMIIHYSGTDADTALAMVGQYHAARLVPVLLLMFSSLLGTMLVPHLTHDWELGKMPAVSRRLNTSIKMLGLALAAIGVGVLLVAPLLFGVFFRGKFAEGLAVLPLTMAFCTWCALGCIARTYLWCDEKASLVSISYCVGLAVTIALNLPLLPMYGLPGGVWSTAIGNLVALLLIVLFGWWRGYAVDRGVLLIVSVPLGFCFGTWTALASLTVVVLLVLLTETVFDAGEKRELVELVRSYWQRARTILRPTAAA